jgi:hypothetical protein
MWYSYTGYTWQHDKRHALWVDNWGYKHTLRMCNNYWYSTATIIVRTRLSVALVRALPVCFQMWNPVITELAKSNKKSRNERIKQRRKKLGSYIRSWRGFSHVTPSLLGTNIFPNTLKKIYCFLPQFTWHHNCRWPPVTTLPVITCRDVSHFCITQYFANRADVVINTTSCHRICQLAKWNVQ